ncbi:MAG: energy-coupling factor transporter transmembrane protein EcfT [Peptococcaceae bacterium]|nr:energy-coupling factor transporter transmembrane protein EcfT [Peptococcaceae bacterium]
MAQLIAFNYFYRDSVIHSLDVRIKFVTMILFSAAIGRITSPNQFIGVSLILLAAMVLSRLPFAELFRQMRYFGLLILGIIVIHSFSVSGTKIAPIPGLTVEGFVLGLFFSWRLFLVIIICVIFTGTTALKQLRKGIEWFLHPIPFLPASRIATMINLVFVLIPMLFDQASEILDAQKARCIEVNRNPIRRIKYLTVPLLLQTFKRADELIMAMESRCYTEERTRPVFNIKMKDWIFLSLSVSIMAVVFF